MFQVPGLLVFYSPDVCFLSHFQDALVNHSGRWQVPGLLSLVRAWRLHPNTRNQAKGMLEELLLAVELRIWFESTRSTFLLHSYLWCTTWITKALRKSINRKENNRIKPMMERILKVTKKRSDCRIWDRRCSTSWFLIVNTSSKAFLYLFAGQSWVFLRYRNLVRDRQQLFSLIIYSVDKGIDRKKLEKAATKRRKPKVVEDSLEEY